MAKKKVKAKAKRAKKKPAKKKVASAVDREAVAEVPAADASRDRELDEGAWVTRIAAAVVAGLVAQQNGNNEPGSQPILDSIQQQLTAIESLLRQSAQAPAAPGAPAPQQPGAAAHASADSIINARRQEIWRAELNQQKPLRLPRPTVVGRAMRDLEPERLEDPSSFSARRVFKWIQEHGAHHLSRTVADLIDAKGRTASSSRIGLFDTRFKRLQGHLLADVKNNEWILTRHGARVFRGWPDWGVADGDVECEGVLRNVTPPEGPSRESDGTTTNTAAPATSGASGGVRGSGGRSASG